MAAHTTVQEVLAALGDVDFPAGKEDLLAAARAAGASEEVQKALRGIPPDEYANRDEVTRSVRLDPADEQAWTPRHRASRRGPAARRRAGTPGSGPSRRATAAGGASGRARSTSASP